MKLNLPSILTREKMLTIFLLTFLQSNEVKAGRNFMNCLNGISSVTTNPYNNLVNFITTRNLVNGKEFCCDDNDFDNCKTNFSDCDRRFDVQGQCRKIGQANFCLISSDNLNPTENANLPSDLCGGILGETSLTESVNGNCASLETARTSLNKTCHTQNLAWLCCRDNDCSLPSNVQIDTENWIANTSCPLNYYSLICLSDSQVWTCTGDTSKNGTHPLKIGSCSFQLPNPSSMKINASGLPTPWPIAAISAVVSIVSIFSFNIERDSVNWFGKSILSFNILRSGAGLVGSMNSLRVNGLEGFEYSELALLIPVTLPPMMLAVKNGLDKLERENSLTENNIDLREFPFQEANSSAVELLEETAEVKERKVKIKSLKRIYSLRYLCWGLVIASFFWQIFASVIYFSRKNYLASSPFVANCDERFVLDKGYFCQDKLRFLEGQSFFFDFTVRILTMAVFLFLSVNFCAAERTKKEQGIGKVKSAFRWFFWTISLYSIMYLIINSVFQAKGLNVENLGNCDLNPVLLSSKTGYLIEWMTQQMTALKQVAFL